MYPILLQIGPFTIYSLWVLLALGVFASLLIVNTLAKSRLVKLSFLAENSLLIFFFSLILARMFFIIYNFGYFWDLISTQGNYLEILYIWDKGLSVWGGLIGIFLSIFLLSRKPKEDFLAWYDILTVSILFGMFFADIGAFLDGRNYGSPTDLPWGVLIEPSQYAIPIHPVQIYAAIYSLLLAVILYQLFNHRLFKNSGIIALTGFTVYCFLRFLEEFLRGDETNVIFGLIREAQLYSLIGLFFGGYLLYRYFRKYFQENH
jgi:phosphatidylglycerol:prolipoprotein diacylglycerol transferase